MEHTKGTWECKNMCGDNRVVVRNGNIDHTIARCGSGTEDKANALRIVKCCNGWDELVEAGNEFIKTFTPHDIRSECFRAYTKLLKLLAAEEVKNE
ncbi:MAG: hypothetical protein MUO31_13235 [Thermodesulfovibrionales bacterium]|nr:hypothetical protein [Thermodesulfovibrionales bacterium]